MKTLFSIFFFPSAITAFGPLPAVHRQPRTVVRDESIIQEPIQYRKTSIMMFYHDDRDERSRGSNHDQPSLDWERSINGFLQASQKSFQHVESGTNRLLNRQPLLALAIFVGAGVMVAYMMGMVFLGGYIENWNPAENDVVPYWDDPVLVIERRVGR
jgi:hypothetical protein